MLGITVLTMPKRLPKDRQCNGQNQRDKMINSSRQNTTQKAKDRATRTHKNGGEHRCSGNKGLQISH